MSQGRRLNGQVSSDDPSRLPNGQPATYPSTHDDGNTPYTAPPPFPSSPTRRQNNNNAPHRGGAHPRHNIPPDSPRSHTNGKPGPDPQSRFPPPSTDIDSLQARIRNMLSDNESPIQQATHPRPSRGGRVPRGGGALYHSPPLLRTQPPPTNTGHRNTRSYSRETPWDNCEDITAYALGIVKSLEIPDDERREKEEFCEELQQLVHRLRPTAKVELFGSFANTFTIANSDIDCCVTDPSSTSDEIQASGLPQQLQSHLTAQGFETTLLTLTRIPILKIFRPATPAHDPSSPSPSPTDRVYKYPLHCDVGWQNRLALHNTALLKTYSTLDGRVRQIVLFVKYWTKCRVISRPRYGTLCSYGYVLMVLYYLTHVASPAVLPNLQGLPMRGGMRLEDVECEGCNIYFSKDGGGWKTQNTESVGGLIKGFFNFFAFEWHFKNNVISIRSPTGMLTKESKGWTALAESTGSQSQTIKSRYLLAIEDPFELSHNVARTVNHQGRLDIRGEFIRAAKMLNAVHGRKQWLTDVCIERVLPDPPPRRHVNGVNGDSATNGPNGEEKPEEEATAGGEEVEEVSRTGHAVAAEPEEEERVRGYAVVKEPKEEEKVRNTAGYGVVKPREQEREIHRTGYAVGVDPEERPGARYRGARVRTSERTHVARIGMARVVLPPINGNGVEHEDIWR